MPSGSSLLANLWQAGTWLANETVPGTWVSSGVSSGMDLDVIEPGFTECSAKARWPLLSFSTAAEH